MKIKAHLLHTEMGRRTDDFSSDLVDAALLICETAGPKAAELYLDENLIDFEITRRVLTGLPHQRRSANTTPLVRFEVDNYRRRLTN